MGDLGITTAELDLQPNFLHVDINAYFASLLQQENPSLRGKPVAVVKEAGRTCVIASSKEAKAAGLKTGCPLIEAKRAIPGLVVVPAQFDLALDATKRLVRLLRQLAPVVEVFSLDEAFLDLTHCRTLYPDPQQLAVKLQAAIHQSLGEWVTASIGIGHTRFLAKLTSETSPKNSITSVTNQNWQALFAKASLADVCGIGHALQRKLQAIGVTNLLLLSMCQRSLVERQVGPWWASQLERMVTHQETHQLSLVSRWLPPKSVGRSVTGFRPLQSEELVRRLVYNLTAEVAAKCRQLQRSARQIWVGLWPARHTDYQLPMWGGHYTFAVPSADTGELFNYILNQVLPHWPTPFPVIKVAVQLNLLQPDMQPPLPFDAHQQRRQVVTAAVDQLNQRFGLFTVRSGLLTTGQIIRPEVTGFFGDKVYQLAQ